MRFSRAGIHRAGRPATVPIVTFALALLVVSPLVPQVQGFDVSRYRPRPLKELTREYPPQDGLVLTRDVPIRAKVIYAGEFRDLPDDGRRVIRAWAEAMNVAGISQGFRRELKVREAGVEYWIPVQEVLVPMMKAELRPGEEIELYLIYVGQLDRRHIFLVNAFDHEGPHVAP